MTCWQIFTYQLLLGVRRGEVIRGSDFHIANTSYMMADLKQRENPKGEQSTFDWLQRSTKSVHSEVWSWVLLLFFVLMFEDCTSVLYAFSYWRAPRLFLGLHCHKKRRLSQRSSACLLSTRARRAGPLGCSSPLPDVDNRFPKQRHQFTRSAGACERFPGVARCWLLPIWRV